MHQARLDRLLQLLQDASLDGMAVIPGPNLLYLTGVSFHLMERPIVALFLRDAEPALILPSFEMSKGQSSAIPFRMFAYDEDEASRAAAFRAAATYARLSGRRLGVEPLRMRYFEFGLLRQAAPESAWVGAEAVVSELRLTKDEAELAAMRRAVEVAELGLQRSLPHIRAGMTERELAGELTLQMLRAGSESELPFPPIVAGGPNSALPHHVPGDRSVQPGDLLIVDWGATVTGYISDLTRTLFLPPLDPELARVHQIVLRANAAGRAAVRPGGSCASIDQAARSLITAEGYGEAFRHRTGHGIGMEAHEPPYIRDDNPQLLQPGMTFTVEPGIYLTGRGGVRIEDNMLVTPDGSECLSSLPRELQPVGA
jgi:Xaa-Pro dipeptidase